MEHQNNAPTVADIVAAATAFRPELAIINFERQWRHHCLSPVYSRITNEAGNVVTLNFKSGSRYVAIYVRVSSIRQRGDVRDDGYSIDYQLRSNIQAAINDGLAFRIYSDAGMSGFLMTNDSSVMEEVRRAKGELYGRIFDEVLLKDAESWNTPEQISDMRTFREAHVQDILRGVKGTAMDERQNDLNWQRVEETLIMRYQYRSQMNAFRPALHALQEDATEIHSVYVTDADRLSRNQLLFVTLGKLFRRSETQVFTSTGEASWLTGTDLTAQLLSVVYPYQAEQKLVQIKQGVMQGITAMLRTGRPHAKVPFWVDRDKNGYAHFVPEKLPILHHLLQHALDDEHIGIARLAQVMEDYGVPSPSGKTWEGSSIDHILNNPWLFGSQVMFGREWPMRTEKPDLCSAHSSPFLLDGADPTRPLATISKEQWMMMKRRRHARYQNAAGRPTPDKKLMAGLLKCQCGFKMVYRGAAPARNSPAGYRCNAPSTVRRKTAAQGVTHTVLRPEQVDEFFLTLMADHADLLILSNEDSADTLDVQEQAIKHEWDRLRAAKRAEMTAHMAALVGSEGGADFQVAVEAMVQAALTKESKNYEAQVTRIDRQRSARGSVRRASGDEIARFRDLPTPEQNRVLRSIIKNVTVEGEPGCEYIQIHLHGDDTVLPPIYLPTRVYKNGALMRRVPTVDEWIMSWQAVT